MQCPYCHINNPPQNILCFACNKPLIATSSDVINVKKYPKVKYFKRLRSFYYRISLAIQASKSSFQGWDNRFGFFSRAWLAGWLSLLPGLGQLYNGQKVKALFFFLAFLSLLSGILYFIKDYLSNWLIYGFFLLIAYSFMDGFLTNIKTHQHIHMTKRQKISVLFYGLFLFGITLFIGQWILYPAVRFVYMNNDNLYPAIHRSDRIAINRMPYWNNPPNRGDLVWYNTGEYVAIDYSKKDFLGETIEDRYVFSKGTNMERILGLPGETIKFLNDKIYINGKELSREYFPLIDGPRPGDLEIILDNNSYFILLSKVPKFGDTISDSVIRYGIFGLFPMDAMAVMEPHKAIIRDTKNWLAACVIKRDDIIGKAWFIYDPPPRRRFF